MHSSLGEVLHEPSEPLQIPLQLILVSYILAQNSSLAFCSVRYYFGLLILNNSLGIFQGCITVYLSRYYNYDPY